VKDWINMAQDEIKWRSLVKIIFPETLGISWPFGRLLAYREVAVLYGDG